jgi:hypothetical protein
VSVATPSPYELWKQAGEKAKPLPCGWPHRRVADDPTPTTGPPYDSDTWPEGCICYLRDDPDWGEVYTRPDGQLCPAHDCSCGVLTCRVHATKGDPA